MKTLIKNSINRFGFLVLLVASVCWTGCEIFASHTDPLAGWRMYFGKADQSIVDDYQNYVQRLSAKERERAGSVFFYEDGTGQHAVEIKYGLNGTVWHHVLIYDKYDKRIKTIKYASGNYGS